MSKAKKFKMLSLLVVCLAALTAPITAEEETTHVARPDLTGRWIVHMRNSLGVKSCNFDIEQEEERLRGKILIHAAPETDLDGRFEGENEVLLWGVYREPRTGISAQLEYKGVYEGEPGEEVLKGECEYFDKRYDFIAKRKKKKK